MPRNRGYKWLDNLKLGKPKKLAQYKPRENGGTLINLRQYRAKPVKIQEGVTTIETESTSARVFFQWSRVHPSGWKREGAEMYKI